MPLSRLAVTLLVSVLLVGAIPAGGHHSETLAMDGGVPLYAGSGGSLAVAPPADSALAFDGVSGLSPLGGGATWQEIATFATAPLAAPLSVNGPLHAAVVAQSRNPIQRETQFQLEFVSGGQTLATVVTQTMALMNHPMEWLGQAPADFVVPAEGSLSVTLRVKTLGGGGEILLGKEGTRLLLPGSLLSARLEGVDVRGGIVHARGVVDAPFGGATVDRAVVHAMGPFGSEESARAAEMDGSVPMLGMDAPLRLLDAEGGRALEWEWDARGVRPGHYQVMLMAKDVTGAWVHAIGVVQIRETNALADVFGGIAEALGLIVKPSPAPDFTVRTSDGEVIRLSDLRGKVVVLDFMATWCVACKKLIPPLKQMDAKYGDDEIVILGIDIDLTEDDAMLNEYRVKYGTTWRYAMDTDKLADKYGVSEMPKVVWINKKGEVSHVMTGAPSFNEFDATYKASAAGVVTVSSAGGGSGFLVLAFLAGVSGFFSPCAFPLLPGYMSYYLGKQRPDAALDANARRRAVRKAAVGGTLAAVGIVLVYLIVGGVIALTGNVVKEYVAYLGPIVAVSLVVLGFVMLTSWTLPTYRIGQALGPLSRAVRSKSIEGQEGSNLGLFAYGVGYGSASLGCHAPLFIAVVLGALLVGGFVAALTAFALYGLGMAVFMVGVTVALGYTQGAFVKRLRNAMPLIKKVSAIVLIVVGVYLTWYYTMPLLGGY
ncbi:MAG TPA: cytochrome c biogenesis protein CcdA [Candidatus Thermoplasmatota archaeon]|nr:cytochrome c biogenesis protein CcdA [Candidatus Thermoplasmatota archaeon]